MSKYTIPIYHQVYGKPAWFQIFEQIKHLKHVTIISDPSMQPGGCHIVTQAGEVDASLESRLNAIRKSIIEASENRCL